MSGHLEVLSAGGGDTCPTRENRQGIASAPDIRDAPPEMTTEGVGRDEPAGYDAGERMPLASVHPSPVPHFLPDGRPDNTVLLAEKQVMQCRVCGEQGPIPRGSLAWVGAVMKAFVDAHAGGAHVRGLTGFSVPATERAWICAELTMPWGPATYRWRGVGGDGLPTEIQVLDRIDGWRPVLSMTVAQRIRELMAGGGTVEVAACT